MRYILISLLKFLESTFAEISLLNQRNIIIGTKKNSRHRFDSDLSFEFELFAEQIKFFQEVRKKGKGYKFSEIFL